jgi:cell division protein FtsB
MEKEFVDKTKKAISKNKFLLTGAIFFAWIALFDSNSCYDQMRLKDEKLKLETEKAYYQEKIRIDSVDLLELKTSDKIEKFARENYMMKKDNEDVFVIVEEEPKAAEKQ